jgi:protein SCO1/2
MMQVALRHVVLLGASLLLAGTAGCGEPRELSASGYVGFELPAPKPKPEFVLTSTQGRPYDFRRETDGYLTLLFFGYTHCPDICPVHMANLAAVLERLPSEISSRVRVVFVTTDPARDSTARLRRWLGNFNPSFVGLTGTQEQLTQAQIAAGVLPAAPDTASGSGDKRDYDVGHSAQVLAFTPDNQERVQYPAGTRQQDWAHDIPLLVKVDQGS